MAQKRCVPKAPSRRETTTFEVLSRTSEYDAERVNLQANWVLRLEVLMLYSKRLKTILLGYK